MVIDYEVHAQARSFVGGSFSPEHNTALPRVRCDAVEACGRVGVMIDANTLVTPTRIKISLEGAPQAAHMAPAWLHLR
jgi:hypothetical protein